MSENVDVNHKKLKIIIYILNIVIYSKHVFTHIHDGMDTCFDHGSLNVVFKELFELKSH